MKSPLKFGFGSGKKPVRNYSNNSSLTHHLKSGTYLVKRRVYENDSKHSNIVKEVQTFE